MAASVTMQIRFSWLMAIFLGAAAVMFGLSSYYSSLFGKASGRVVAAGTGTSVAGAEVELYGEFASGEKTMILTRQTTTDEDGRFRLNQTVGGAFRLTVKHVEFETLVREAVPVNREADTDLGVIELSKPAAEEGDESDPEHVPSRPLFNGRDLGGWRKVGGEATFRVEEGCIVGETGPGPSTFLRTEDTFRDFILALEFRVDAPINSGIQIRSHLKDGNGVVFGYQCEIDPGGRAWTGGIYDEGRRGWLQSLEGREDARRAYQPDAWNRYRIEAIGNRLRTWVNNVPCADLEDDEDAEGFIALQVHSGRGGRIRWRSVRIQEVSGG